MFSSDLRTTPTVSALLTAAAILLLSAPVHADRITLTSGKVIEGRIVSEEDGRATIELDSGARITIPRSSIGAIVAAPTSRERLAEREAALEPGNAEALAGLARWCDAEGLDADRDRLYWRLLEIEPNHVTARKTLGFEKLGALWLTEAEWHRHHGRVEHDGKWIPEEEWERLVAEEESLAELDAAEDALETAARADRDPEAARVAYEKFASLPAERKRYALAKGLEAKETRVRQMAVRLTGELEGRKPIGSLTHVAVSDRKRSVRDEALRVLKTWDDPDTALGFLNYLESDEDRERVNAARALNVFPDRRAVPVLINTTRKIWAGFGRAYIMQAIQRSYVQDYELVSGGTGLVVSEVADPVVDTFIEGIVLDVDVRRAEAIARLATLERITGQRFGADFEAWAKWWDEEKGTQKS